MTAIEKIKSDIDIMAMAQKLGLDLDTRMERRPVIAPGAEIPASTSPFTRAATGFIASNAK